AAPRTVRLASLEIRGPENLHGLMIPLPKSRGAQPSEQESCAALPCSGHLLDIVVERARWTVEDLRLHCQVLTGGDEPVRLEMLVHDLEIMDQPVGHHLQRLGPPCIHVVASVCDRVSEMPTMGGRHSRSGKRVRTD